MITDTEPPLQTPPETQTEETITEPPLKKARTETNYTPPPPPATEAPSFSETPPRRFLNTTWSKDMPNKFTYENFNTFVLPGDDTMYDSLEPEDLVITTAVH